MRSILTAIILLFGLFPCSPVLGIFCLIGRKDPDRCHRISFRFVQAFLRAVVRVSGAEIDVRGRENIPRDRSAVFISNHRSYYDIFITYALTEREMGYIAKQEIARIPLVGRWMANIRCLFLNREDPREGIKTIQAGAAQVEAGIPMWIFAEGHRTDGDTMLPFKDGSFKLATKPGAPIIPVTIEGTERIFEQHMPWVRKTKVTLIYGEPIETAGLDRKAQKELAGRVQNVIAGELRQLALAEGREPADPAVDPELYEKQKPGKH
ncbi:MAG: 1-acyl-sn-glycerol-3-phosphate acyltransferase [Lachnospiraceae bacterium]|nr:1-acyl-sn-glycerol-3-phosphate acyltransferase [Lachnospiraceae bacterium]MBR0106544.1 1-acyl-sn-glycerol-3-phosphate acyltransferase [Lachnospiraceae bacterium]